MLTAQYCSCATPSKKTHAKLQDGHLLAVFPAGEVSHLQLNKGVIVDSKWNPFVLGDSEGLTVFREKCPGGRIVALANSPMFQSPAEADAFLFGVEGAEALIDAVRGKNPIG